MSHWLRVPLADYEGHMSAAGVEQLAPLADLFRQALTQTNPESVAILGIAGGNGLEHIDPAWLVAILAPRGLRLQSETRHPLPSGKAFWHGIFRR